MVQSPLGSGQPAFEVWLRHENLDKAERLERLTADKQLIDFLRSVKFTGPEWDFVATELARYGLAVVRGWVRSNEIGQKCRQKNLPCPAIPDWVRRDPEAPADIATETVAIAIVRFRDDVLAKGMWDPGKGASLRTFFVGQCLLRFPNAYRVWEKTGGASLAGILTEDQVLLSGAAMPSVEDDVIHSQMAKQILAGASSERAARVLAMDILGFSNAEIAADIGVSEEALKSLLRRERKKLRKEMSVEKGAS